MSEKEVARIGKVSATPRDLRFTARLRIEKNCFAENWRLPPGLLGRITSLTRSHPRRLSFLTTDQTVDLHPAHQARLADYKRYLCEVRKQTTRTKRAAMRNPNIEPSATLPPLPLHARAQCGTSSRRKCQAQ